MNVETSKIESANLFAFIREYVRLKQKPVESLDSYIQTFWLDQIPRESECSFIAWNAVEEKDAVIENWLAVERPERPDPPPVEEELMPWINDRQWHDSSIEMPELFSRIIDPDWTESNSDEESQYLELENHPHLKERWESYIENEWWVWAEADQRKAKVQEAYDKLFSMHRTQVSVGDQYEFLLSVGCLHWDAPNGGKVKRHILSIPVAIAFDSANAVVTVQSAGSTPESQLETDMLSVNDRPSTDIEEEAENRKNLLGDQIFHADAKKLLKSYVQGLDSEGVFLDELDRVSGAPTKTPVIAFAPALIVRRRTSRSLISACNSIVSQLQNGLNEEELPPSVRKLVGELGVDESVFGGQDQNNRQGNALSDKEVYFPLQYNDEQREILDRLDRQVGVLVQGPPGTGKSQSIANLICHLLATGKRILVTSQKAPALRVLQEKLPPEVAALCIMILGEGPDEQRELRQSVGEIVNRYADRSSLVAHSRIATHRKDLTKAREAVAKEFEILCSVREQETFRHPPLFGKYEGTLSDISKQVNRDSQAFTWFEDRLPDSLDLVKLDPPECPIEQGDVKRLLGLLRDIDPEDEARAACYLTSLECLPPVEEFREMVGAETKACRLLENLKQYKSHPAYESISSMSNSELIELHKSIDEFHSRLQGLKNNNSDWEWKTAVGAIQGNNDALRALREVSYELLYFIEKESKDVVDLEVSGLGERSSRAVLHDAKALKKHFENGGKKGLWIFRSSVVKKGLYLLQEVRVDGGACQTPGTLEYLIRWLQLHEATRKLGEQWSVLKSFDFANLPLNQMTGKYKQLHSRLDKILELGNRAEAINRRLDNHDRGIPRFLYDLNAVTELRGVIRLIIAELKHQKAWQKIQIIQKKIDDACLKENAAEVNHRLRNAVRERLIEEYIKSLEDLTKHWNCYQYCQERDRIQAELSEALPELSRALNESYEDGNWDERINKLHEAWNWLCADKWLTQMADPNLDDSLSLSLRQRRRELSHCLTKLVAEKAWQFCMDNMTEEAYQSLIAWRKAIERLGGGTGKYAERHRSHAKERLEECRQAIPAWVMPLYKVFDTVSIKPSVFDVVIIDEASQSGPDALFLAFLAKQIIVVGDDQQIRPENVGIDQSMVYQLQRRYLRDIPKWDVFGATESLFSIAEVRFGNPIRLREHFRCMPEIISFSNRLCYHDQPLIPLRQFGKDRLSPVLNTTYVSEAYQEKRKVNPKEAEVIADKIERCCEDPAYNGKTFGVISLLHSSDQAIEIESQLIKRLDAEEIEQRNIVCGDSYDFQGDERDVIFLSMVSARRENGRIVTMSDAKAKRRFNVAVSRARDQIFLAHSVQEGELGENCVRRRLLAHMKQPQVDPIRNPYWTIEELRKQSWNATRKRGNQPAPFDSWFEVDVFLTIADQGYLAVPQYEVHNYRIDIVIIGGSRKIAVECDGDQWHGLQQYANDLHRQTQLERCGWEFFRVRGSSFYRDPDKALLPLWEILETQDEEVSHESESPGVDESRAEDEKEETEEKFEHQGATSQDDSEYKEDEL